jgi:hypothetical protein
MTMPTDDELSDLLFSLGSEVFDDDSRAHVDAVLASGQAVEPVARRKFVLAAQRGLRARQLLRGSFEVLAFETRRESGIDIDELAAAVGASSEDLRSVERGSIALVDQSPVVVARWIHELRLSDSDGLHAAERSVRSSSAQSAYASAGGEAVLTDKAVRFLDDLRVELEKLSASPSD